MTARQSFQKALLTLDQGRLEEGEVLLRSVIKQANTERDHYTYGRALCCLGDFLYQEGQSQEAEETLRQFISLERDDDVLDVEQRRVEELLEAIARSRAV